MSARGATRILALALVLSAGCAGRSGGPTSDLLKPQLNPESPLDERIIAAEKAASDRPDDAAAHMEVGNAYINRGWGAPAVEAFNRAIELTPDSPKAWNNLGLAWLKLKESKEAVEALEQALELDPLFAEAHYNLATTFESRGSYDEALYHYKIALLADPSLAKPTTNPHARESRVVTSALVSLYLDSTASLALEPELPRAGKAPRY